jgi:hypothetical protein
MGVEAWRQRGTLAVVACLVERGVAQVLQALGDRRCAVDGPRFVVGVGRL